MEPLGAFARRQRGSGLVIAILVTVILTLLGISFLLLSETENRIARNDKLSAQALYLSEAGVRAVKRWFDYTDASIGFPDDSVADRTMRVLIDESDPYDPADYVTADGVPGSYPYYKQSIDLNGDGDDDLFLKPYRGGLEHLLLGTEDGPDLRIDDGDPTAAAFLDDMTTKLLGNFPGEGGGVFGRISRVDLFAPPYLQFGGNWVRYGMGTLRVTARIYRDTGSTLETLAERTVTAVLSETPYQGPVGPLHSCGNATIVRKSSATSFPVLWGAISALADVRITPTVSFASVPTSIPRGVPTAPGGDRFWTSDPTVFDSFKASTSKLDQQPVPDPWFRVLAGGSIANAPASGPAQPFGVPPSSTAPDFCCDRSDLMQNQALSICPDYDYDVWKGIALSGFRDVRYFAYVGAGQFRENGSGMQGTFADLSRSGALLDAGLYFFDTEDGLRPTDVDGDGDYDNLTPDVTITGNYLFEGMVYLNAQSIRFNVSGGDTVPVRPPGEPYLDGNGNGRFDPGERWANLAWNTANNTHGNPIVANKTHATAGTVQRDERGEPIVVNGVSFLGILFTNGTFEATGAGAIYGTVVARSGVTQSPADGSATTPTIIWNESIVRDWPEAGYRLPRVVITRWEE